MMNIRDPVVSRPAKSSSSNLDRAYGERAKASQYGKSCENGTTAHKDAQTGRRPLTSRSPDNPADREYHPQQMNILPVVVDDSPELPASPHAFPPGSISRSVTLRIYISHFLSTWNSRLFEMGSVLFIAAIFPGTLLPMSAYALARSGAAIILSPAVGSWIDVGNRLNVVRFSIVGQRLAVAASCGLFWMLYERKELGRGLKNGLFAVTVVLACVEKLCSVMNLVSVERDWAVVITRDDVVARRLLNARMRRIDLFCKLLGPLAISLVDGASTIVAIWVTLAMNCCSVPIEYFAIATVFRMVPNLQRPAPENRSVTNQDIGLRPSMNESSPIPRQKRTLKSLRAIASHILPLKPLPFYFHHAAFLPSIALSLLYLTVLSFSGQMIVFLLAIGYTPFYVGIARALSTVFELSATWITPTAQRHIGAVRGGIWFLSWQMLWLAGGPSWFFAVSEDFPRRKIFAASGLVGGVVLSRVGLWGFDLCAQSIVQEEVDEDHRGAFSTVEASFQNLFELLSYGSTMVFSRPHQFQWPVVISVIAVYVAGGLYAVFVRRRRGHLVHMPRCIKPPVDRPE